MQKDTENEDKNLEWLDTNNIPSITHNIWEEDGQRYSSWTINTGNTTLHTGDAGMELINKEFLKEGFSLPASLEQAPKHKYNKQTKSKYIP